MRHVVIASAEILIDRNILRGIQSVVRDGDTFDGKSLGLTPNKLYRVRVIKGGNLMATEI